MMSEEDEMDTPGFEVRHIDNHIGKGVFATKAYKNGDIIFEERPLVSCQFLWNAAYGYSACNNCMTPLEGAEENARRLAMNYTIILPHPQCCETDKTKQVDCPYCEVQYCGVECREEAWRAFHQTLCLGQSNHDPNHPLVQLQEAWKQLHYPPETACIMLLARMIASIRQAKDKEGAMHLYMQFCHRTVNEEEEIAHKLLGEKFQGQLEKLRDLMIKALYAEDVQNWLTPEGFRSLVALVGTNGQGVGTSPLSVWVRNCDNLELPEEERQKLDKFIDNLYVEVEKQAGGFLNNEGSALYTIQSTCNHSCVPNAMPGFPYNDNRLSMVATKDIEPGQQICVSYLDECTLDRSRHSRIKQLRQNYLFTCHCPRCEQQKDDPDMTSESEDEDMSDS